MSLESVIADLEAVLRRLRDVQRVEAKRSTPRQRVHSEYPRMVYRRNPDGNGVQSMVVHSADEVPSDCFSSPDEALNGKATQTKEVIPTREEIAIPVNWESLDGRTLIATAKRLPGGDEVRTKDDALIVIGLEAERRANAA